MCYQKPSIKEILIGIASSGISDQLRDIYFICSCCWIVSTYSWEVHSEKIKIISFVINACSEPDQLSVSSCEVDVGVTVVFIISYFKLNGIDTINRYRTRKNESSPWGLFEEDLMTNVAWDENKKSLKIPKGQLESKKVMQYSFFFSLGFFLT